MFVEVFASELLPGDECHEYKYHPSDTRWHKFWGVDCLTVHSIDGDSVYRLSYGQPMQFTTISQGCLFKVIRPVPIVERVPCEDCGKLLHPALASFRHLC